MGEVGQIIAGIQRGLIDCVANGLLFVDEHDSPIMAAVRARIHALSARISRQVIVGRYVKFFNGKTIGIGEGTTLRRGCELYGPVEIGPRSYLNRFCYVMPNTVIGSDCAIGPFCRFITVSHEAGDQHRRAGSVVNSHIRLGDGVWMEPGCTVMGPVNIGTGAVILAGSVIREDVPPNVIVGNAGWVETKRVLPGGERG